MHRYCSTRTTIRECADRALRAASMCPVRRPLDVLFLGNEQSKGHEWPLPSAVRSRP